MKDKLTIEVDNTSDTPITITHGDYSERVNLECTYKALPATLNRHQGTRDATIKTVKKFIEALGIHDEPTDPISQHLIHDPQDDDFDPTDGPEPDIDAIEEQRYEEYLDNKEAEENNG